MDANLKRALSHWEAIHRARSSRQDDFNLVDQGVDRLLHGDPSLGQGLPWCLLTDRGGSALRRLSAYSWDDRDLRVVAQCDFYDWATRMKAEGKRFMSDMFPVLCLYVTPDDPSALGGFETESIRHHNAYAHEPNNRQTLACHCVGECLGYGYAAIRPGAQPSITVLLRALQQQSVIYPSWCAIGEHTILITGTAEDHSRKMLLMRRATDWEVEITNEVHPPLPPSAGPVYRETRVMKTMATKQIGNHGILNHHSLFVTGGEPTLIPTAAKWRLTRTAFFTPTGGALEQLTVVNFESIRMST